MKTDDLIRYLANDTAVRARFGAILVRALLLGVLLSAMLLLSTVGIRHNMGTAMGSARVLLKIFVTLTLAVTASGLFFRIGHPGVPLRLWSLALLLPLVILVASIAMEMTAIPEESWKGAILGRNLRFCLLFILVLSLPPLACFLHALKHGAPERPALAGAVAGLAAGGIAAALYALHCPDDSPLFFGIWYVIAIAVVASVGALIGHHTLKW